jgi:hypothetical protein
MFHELRQYDLDLSGVGTFLENFEKAGLPAMTRCGFEVRVDPEYIAFGQSIKGIVRRIDTRILRNVSFSPLLRSS